MALLFIEGFEWLGATGTGKNVNISSALLQQKWTDANGWPGGNPTFVIHDGRTAAGDSSLEVTGENEMILAIRPFRSS